MVTDTGEDTMKRALGNICLVFVIVFPIWFAGLWLTATVLKGPQGRWWEAFGFYFLIMAPPLLVGGAIQQIILRLFPSGWPPSKKRIAAIISTLVIPLAFLLFKTDPGMLLSVGMAVPMTIALVAYGAVVRLPEAAISPMTESEK